MALSGRDESGLEPLLAFLARYINHPDFSAPLTDACNMVLGTASHLSSLLPLKDVVPTDPTVS